MSEIKKKLQQDMKDAMRARNQVVLDTVRGVIAEVKKTEIDTRKELDDSGVLAVLQKEMKKRRDAMGFAEQGQRADIIEQARAEMAILERYLGAQLSDAELEELIRSLVEGGADNIGKVMGGLNKEHKGKFDGKRASEIAKSMLG